MSHASINRTSLSHSGVPSGSFALARHGRSGPPSPTPRAQHCRIRDHESTEAHKRHESTEALTSPTQSAHQLSHVASPCPRCAAYSRRRGRFDGNGISRSCDVRSSLDACCRSRTKSLGRLDREERTVHDDVLIAGVRGDAGGRWR